MATKATWSAAVIPRKSEYEAENMKMYGNLGESDHATEKNQRLREEKRFQEMVCEYTKNILIGVNSTGNKDLGQLLVPDN